MARRKKRAGRRQRAKDARYQLGVKLLRMAGIKDVTFEMATYFVAKAVTPFHIPDVHLAFAICKQVNVKRKLRYGTLVAKIDLNRSIRLNRLEQGQEITIGKASEYAKRISEAADMALILKSQGMLDQKGETIL